jgi:MTH538 TIR-like domain (DUF1863).
MADPRAFVSFDFDNNSTEKLLFVGQAKNSRTPFTVQDWSSKETLPQPQWERLINEKIAKTNMLIVLVGRWTYLATGVKKEIAMAKANNVPVFGVLVGGATTYTSLPAGLSSGRVIAWDWDRIASAIKQMMKEGKNAA